MVGLGVHKGLEKKNCVVVFFNSIETPDNWFWDGTGLVILCIMRILLYGF